MTAAVVPLRRFEEPVLRDDKVEVVTDPVLPAIAVVGIVLIVAVAVVAVVAMATGNAISWDVQLTSYFHWKSCIGNCSH